MVSVIVAFPKIEDAKKIKNILVKNGYEIDALCTMAAQVMNLIDKFDEGIVICGYRLLDMHYSILYNNLPKNFQMLLIASAAKLNECTDNNIICLSIPFKTIDLVNTVETITYNYRRRKRNERKKPKQRSEQEKETIYKAKILLMERNHMSEQEAYRYIQKTSMDNGTNMTETAEMILSLM